MPPNTLAAGGKRIAVMTSGGDSPGMSGAVRAVVRQTLIEGCTSYAVYQGYEGLVRGGDLIREMNWEDVRGWLSEGGTLIGSARCKSFMERPGRLTAANNMIEKSIDALIVCGGDGSLTGADKFRGEWPSLMDELVSTGKRTEEEVKPFRHLNIVGLVGSIDNDLSGTDATIGCYTALGNICDVISKVDTTAFSHQRAFVVEVMGRHCGWLALMSGLATGADYVFCPETPPSQDWKAELCDVVKQHRAMGKQHTIVIVAEGAHDRDLNPIKPDMVKDVLSDDVGLDTRVSTLGHLQRGGAPCAFDRVLATLQGVEAVKAVLDATPDTPSPVICMVNNKIVRKNLMDAIAQTNDVTAKIGRKEFTAAMKGRDTDFVESFEAFKIINSTDNTKILLPQGKRMRVGIIHVGAPAGGMNAATRAAVAYLTARGHTPVAFHNGFSGLCRHHDDKPIGSVRELTWLQAESWGSKGSSEIGTNRSLPSEDFKTTAYCLEKYKIDALFVVGGFEAFTAVSELESARAKYDAFKIPMVILPATVSNNVPGTEYSLGSDTCLNQLTSFCDAIKLSAGGTRRRVFVVETQGGASGYIPTLAGLAVGAVVVYTPEEGITHEMLAKDIEYLKDQFADDTGTARNGKIILRSEKACDVYTTKFLADAIKKAAGGKFDAKTSVPGHYQQGNIPSPMDRVRAIQLAIKSLQLIETYTGKSKDQIAADPMSAALIGIRGANVTFDGVEHIGREETDWKHRRPKDEFWMEMADVVNALSGRRKAKGAAL
ncbi:ATP-dependent 6-phosphofructokinase [Fulvia fulva]|uniref:ATP-dependent 6-phosphofructokinase n=1 Tax=Passalora fulva TaxID=5499 RepID=A0A9Q8URD7_PASFU|nr:ATP-dependent 6-phosphofructokinase [Fulvia fulva]KAK4619913.1 ATP-dependent 6-phosphofructokinase [Fulvia fulva]KAK4620894.1 ATP-dependent 6-phosphofructokinase [Fulvia fulva]UJO19602.1 ATP-dependent 6-phosphofructokinase [Fulvia fulva]WPV17429.1 ATP-dependent 6-phosphofructokinase [Fulvia fulva]WPV32614.1 ATP-dependent 6-phosphofructokinase [Fulvia fulva]